MALAQNITFTEKFGFVVIFNNLFHILIVGILFVPEIFRHENDFVSIELEKWRFWTVPLAILAFWAPMDELGQPDFSPMLLFTSGYGIAFCFTARVLIFILTLYYPNVYKPAYRFLCITGAYIGILNLTGPSTILGYPVWVAFLHIPLFPISIYGLTLEKMKHRAHEADLIENRFSSNSQAHKKASESAEVLLKSKGHLKPLAVEMPPANASIFSVCLV